MDLLHDQDAIDGSQADGFLSTMAKTMFAKEPTNAFSMLSGHKNFCCTEEL